MDGVREISPIEVTPNTFHLLTTPHSMNDILRLGLAVATLISGHNLAEEKVNH